MQHTPRVGQQDPGRGDVQQPGRVLRQAAQQVDGVDAVGQVAGERHEGSGDRAFPIGAHGAVPSPRSVGWKDSSSASETRRSTIAQAASLAVSPWAKA